MEHFGANLSYVQPLYAKNNTVMIHIKEKPRETDVPCSWIRGLISHYYKGTLSASPTKIPTGNFVVVV